ncbi:MAG: polyisoprenoid-binding protein [Acidobacteria bacterium]|nr:MAG: polyisoprenoid-binding protein [Acidobacteriota bacterium]REK02355.1 MAG: polyisoprenoid-binding protein [Acidobacteriota bacterium]REK13843.1 MAG: polyisoprenoid-binding protein [Acidobacteriota bacterium]REK41838.1 MAG: polyisoprenoid-binding protein [Acidobacteriota bacterium]
MKVISSILLFSTLILATPFLGNTITFRIDTNHSNIGFAVPISGGLSEVHGKFSRFDMDLVYDEKDITRSAVEVAIDVSSIDTGIDQRDEHLRTADFFDVPNHPKINFKSKKIEKKAGELIMTGDFTMRGVTKEISFPFKIAGKSMNEEGTKLSMGFTAELKLNRTDYNVNYQHQAVPGFIGNEVTVYLNILTRPATAMSDK